MSFLHDIWNPWHGCVKCSEGCQNCYMYFLDRMRDQNGAEIYKTKSGFSYPLQKDRTGHYKIQSGEQIRSSMKNQKKKSFPRRVFLCLLAVLLAICIAFGVYVSDYYHADPAAEDAMVSDRFVSVTEQNGNWVFAPE